MIVTVKTTSDGKARIVTSSAGHLFGRLDFDTFKDTPERRKRATNALYSQSKFVRKAPPLRSTESDTICHDVTYMNDRETWRWR